MLCLQGITGDMVVLSWLYRRAAHWLLDRNGVRGHMGDTLLEPPADDEDEDEQRAQQEAEAEAEAKPRVIDDLPLPARKIYCLDLRWHNDVAPYVDEVRRITSEASVQTVDLLGFIGGTPKPEQIERFLAPAAGNVDAAPAADRNGHGNGHAPLGNPSVATPAIAANGEPAQAHEPVRIVEEAGRRWYPVIDFSRCTNCMECLDFCLFGVYGVDRAETILVEQPDNCRKGCPACSRVCPENAIIFPQHKSPAIAGSPEVAAGAFKIDLSKLFGAPEGLDAAVSERDAELVAAGRDAVGATVGMPKRQSGKPAGPKDDLDSLMDELDSLDL
jgi:NAD-dependent dihydropyrimidine dehydrogenase PreA subunit